MASLVEAAGNVLDLPASMIRDALVLRNPIDQFLSPLGQDNRTSGNEMLNMIGLEGDSPWLGLGLEMALDPTTYLGWGALSKGAKGYAAASKALKAAGKKAGVTGVARELLSPAAKKLDDLRAARKARAGARASQGLDTQLSGIEKRIAELEAQGQLPAGAAAQATAGVQAAAGANTIDEAAQILDAIPNPNAREAAMKALTDQYSGWTGFNEMPDVIGNFDDARLLDALMEGNTGAPFAVSKQLVPPPRRLASNFDTVAATQQNAAVDAMLNALTEQSTGAPFAIGRQPVPPARRLASNTDTLAATQRNAAMDAMQANAISDVTAGGAASSRLAGAAGTLMETLVSPGMVDMDELAKLVGRNTPPPPPPPPPAATRGLNVNDARKLEMLRNRRQTILGADAAGRRQYLDAANAIREQPIPELMGRRLPTMESIRNATYRDPRFRQVFGGGGAILAADEGRSGNPYDPYAADEMGMEPDELMRAMMAYRGR